MKPRKKKQGESRLVCIDEFCCYVSLGESKALEFAREHGIAIKIGRATRYDLRKTDEVINALTNIGEKKNAPC